MDFPCYRNIRNNKIGSYTLFYKQHLYKQRQDEIGKKKNKQMLKKSLGWTFATWKLFTFFIQVIIQK